MMSLRRTGTLLLASLLLTCLRVAAQNQRPATDTTDTTVADTVVAAPPEGNALKSDSVYDSSADTTASASDSLLARTVPDSVVREWKRAPAFAYANDPRYWKRVPQESGSLPVWLIRFLESNAFRYGVYILLGALLLYAIGRIVTENQLGIFYRGAKRSGGSQGETADETVEEDLDLRIRQSIDNRDYRQAVRYSYLRALRRLDERGLIRYHGRATDQEYLRQLGGTVLEAPFRFLTNAYEKVWYGEFGLSEETFRRLIGYFSEFDKTIPG